MLTSYYHTPKYMPPSHFIGFRVPQYLFFCVLFCRPLHGFFILFLVAIVLSVVWFLVAIVLSVVWFLVAIVLSVVWYPL
jgi:hypothetical protein